MKKWLAHFTVTYLDMHGDTCICEGALPFMASDDDAYFIAEALFRDTHMTYEYHEEVPS